jgi:hypothetical protein
MGHSSFMLVLFSVPKNVLLLLLLLAFAPHCAVVAQQQQEEPPAQVVAGDDCPKAPAQHVIDYLMRNYSKSVFVSSGFSVFINFI